MYWQYHYIPQKMYCITVLAIQGPGDSCCSHKRHGYSFSCFVSFQCPHCRVFPLRSTRSLSADLSTALEELELEGDCAAIPESVPVVFHHVLEVEIDGGEGREVNGIITIFVLLLSLMFCLCCINPYSYTCIT